MTNHTPSPDQAPIPSPQTSAEGLKGKLQDPSVRAVLANHLREQITSGIIQLYFQHYGDQYRSFARVATTHEFPPSIEIKPGQFVPRGPYADNKVPLEPEDSILTEEQVAERVLEQHRAMETPILVGKYFLEDDVEDPECESFDEIYFLEKVDVSTGEALFPTKVDVGTIRVYKSGVLPDYEDEGGLYPDPLTEFTPEHLEVIARQYQEQVEAGIVFKGHYQ